MAKKYIDADKLKAEIERRKRELDEQIVDIQDSKAVLRKDELQRLLSFLDTLSEKPDKSLEEEYMDYVVNDPDYSKLVNRIAGLGIARHFAEWGAEHLRDSTKMIDKSLEEAAEEYYQKEVEETKCHHASALTYAQGYEDALLRVKDAFIAGAEWQKEQDMKMLEANWGEGFRRGKVVQKDQMLKDAVEGEAEELYNDGESQCVVSVGTYFEPGDKVYVLKAEEE